MKRPAVVLLSLIMLISCTGVPLAAFSATLVSPSVSVSNASVTSVKVTWKKVSTAKKYTVYQSTKKSSGFKALKTVTTNSYTVKKLKTGKTYYYKVKAVNGSESATSKVVSIKAAPAKVKPSASKTCSSIKLSFKKASGVTGFQVWAASSEKGTYKKLTDTAKTSYTQKKLKCGVTKYYKVRAYKKVSGKKVYSKYSDVLSVKTAHAPSTAYKVTKKATCANTGTKTNICKHCKKKYTVTIPKDETTHIYTASEVSATKEHESYTLYKCKVCGDTFTSKIKAHKYVGKVTEPTCIEKGYTTYTCSDCNYTYVSDYTDFASHTYEEKHVPANCTDDGYKINVCSICGYVDESSKEITEKATGTDHEFEEKTVEPTCVDIGYTAQICTICGYVDEKTMKDTVPALGHDFVEEYEVDENNFRVHDCSRCDEKKVDTTCYIDITDETVSNPKFAEFGKSSTNTGEINDKLDLYADPDGLVDFEITGTRENFAIDIDADYKIDVKLAGVTIKNTDKDCINVKNKATVTDENGAVTEGEAPKVSISAKDGTENYLEAKNTGNAIDGKCPLEIKGHGKLTIVSDKTAITNEAKLTIKNLTLDIDSKNRGIDTKTTVMVPNLDGELVESEDYFNIEIGANANIKIVSSDDGIRCKNMDITELKEGDTDTVININAVLDGIQLEGNKGFTALSGDITIKAGKYAFNCRLDRISISGSAKVNATGASGYSK